jgi:hypothetical protein
MGWMTKGSEFESQWGKNFLFSKLTRLILVSIEPPIQWILGDFSREVKRPRREADQSPPASAEVTKMWIYISTSPHVFMA